MHEFRDTAAERARLNRYVEAYLAKGGKVHHVPMGASATNPDSLPDPAMRERARAALARSGAGWGWGSSRKDRAQIAVNARTLGEMVAKGFSRVAICKGMGLPMAKWHLIVARAERAGIVLPDYLLREVL